MKAIVLEAHNGKAAVLCEDGQIRMLRRNYAVGESVELETPKNVVSLFSRSGVKVAAAAALTLAIMGGSYSYLAIPANAYVSLDAGKAAVEVRVNRLGRITSVDPVNEDSKELARKLTGDLRGKPVEQAIPHAVSTICKHVVSDDDDDGYILAGVTAPSESQETELTRTIAEAASDSTGEEAVELYTVTVTNEERSEAAHQEESGARLAFRRRGMKRLKRRNLLKRMKKQQEALTEQIPQSEQPAETIVLPTQDPAAVSESAAVETVAPPVAETESVIEESPASPIAETAAEQTEAAEDFAEETFAAETAPQNDTEDAEDAESSDANNDVQAERRKKRRLRKRRQRRMQRQEQTAEPTAADSQNNSAESQNG